MKKLLYPVYFILLLSFIQCEEKLKGPVNPLDPVNVTEEPLAMVCIKEIVKTGSSNTVVNNTVYWKNDFIHDKIKQIVLNGTTLPLNAYRLDLSNNSSSPSSYKTIPSSYNWSIPVVVMEYDKTHNDYYLRIKIANDGFSFKDAYLAEDSLGLNMLSLNDHIASRVDYSNKYEGNYNIQVDPNGIIKKYSYIKFIWYGKEPSVFCYFSLFK